MESKYIISTVLNTLMLYIHYIYKQNIIKRFTMNLPIQFSSVKFNSNVLLKFQI